MLRNNYVAVCRLFVSPKLPPTPAHKKVSPQQWLSEGHNRNRDADLPSLSEVRKTLVFSMNEAENLIGSSRVVPGKSSNITVAVYSDKNNSNYSQSAIPFCAYIVG